MKKFVKTRWNYWLMMLERMLQIKEELEFVINSNRQVFEDNDIILL